MWKWLKKRKRFPIYVNYVRKIKTTIECDTQHRIGRETLCAVKLFVIVKKFEAKMYWLAHLEGGPRRVNHTAVAIGDYIYSFGGYCSNEDYGNFWTLFFFSPFAPPPTNIFLISHFIHFHLQAAWIPSMCTYWIRKICDGFRFRLGKMDAVPRSSIQRCHFNVTDTHPLPINTKCICGAAVTMRSDAIFCFVLTHKRIVGQNQK